MWSASFYLGNFIGPTVSGIFVDVWGFKYTTLILFVVYLFCLFIDSLDLLYNMKKSVSYSTPKHRIIEREKQENEKTTLLFKT